MGKSIWDLEMSFQYFRIIGLHPKEGGEALHLDECREKCTLFVFADTKIKGNEMGNCVLPLNHLLCRNGCSCECIEIGMDDKIDDGFTGLDHLLPKLSVNEYRGLRNPKINGTRVCTVQVLEKIFIFLLAE